MRRFPFLLVTGFHLVHGAPSFPLQDGEQLTYRVSWAVVLGAGEIKIDAHQDPASRDRLVVTSTTATRGFARMLLRFDARADSIFDLATGKLLSLHEAANTRGKETEHTVAFDYAARSAVYAVPDGTVPPRNLALPDGEPSDLIMALLQTRSWSLKPGGSRDALVLFNDDFYELTIYATGYEDVKTPLGMFKTVVLEPRMEKTPPKGMFKRGSTVRVWIAQDDRRLPVRFEVEFNIGTGTANLVAYQPPASAPTSAAAAAPAPKPEGTPAPAKPDAKDSRP